MSIRTDDINASNITLRPKDPAQAQARTTLSMGNLVTIYGNDTGLSFFADQQVLISTRILNINSASTSGDCATYFDEGTCIKDVNGNWVVQYGKFIGAGSAGERHNICIGDQIGYGYNPNSACYSVLIGNDIESSGSFSVILGNGQANQCVSNVLIGSCSSAKNNDTIILGNINRATGSNVILIGNNNETCDFDPLSGSGPLGEKSILIGSHNLGSCTSGPIYIGHNNQGGDIIIGTNNYAPGGGRIFIGHNISLTEPGDILFGYSRWYAGFADCTSMSPNLIYAIKDGPSGQLTRHKISMPVLEELAKNSDAILALLKK